MWGISPAFPSSALNKSNFFSSVILPLLRIRKIYIESILSNDNRVFIGALLFTTSMNCFITLMCQVSDLSSQMTDQLIGWQLISWSRILTDKGIIGVWVYSFRTRFNILLSKDKDNNSHIRSSQVYNNMLLLQRLCILATLTGFGGQWIYIVILSRA